MRGKKHRRKNKQRKIKKCCHKEKLKGKDYWQVFKPKLSSIEMFKS
jgi:hypothetical protein